MGFAAAAGKHTVHWDPSVAPFGATGRGYDKTYSISINPGESNGPRGTYFDSEYAFASMIFHEASHSLSVNNRKWHNPPDLLKHSFTECRNSVFEDRTYLMQASCFPFSKIGNAFYFRRAITEVYPLTTLPESGTTQDFYRQTAAANCQNVCVSAFTTADPDYMQERGSSPGTTKMIGPPLRAILSSKEEANIQRTRIREASTRYRALWEEKIKSFDRLQRQENALIDKFRQLDSISVSSGKVSDPLHRLDEAGQDLLLRYSRMMEEILLKTEDFYSGQVTWNDLHEQISGPVIQLQSKFESYCVTGALSQGWKWICDHKTIPAFNSIEVLRSRTKNIGQVDREIIRLWASPK